jgi:2'-5' RNA ligase
VDWPVWEFVLVRSRLSAGGPDYDVLERFALG